MPTPIPPVEAQKVDPAPVEIKTKQVCEYTGDLHGGMPIKFCRQVPVKPAEEVAEGGENTVTTTPTPNEALTVIISGRHSMTTQPTAD